MWERTLTLGGAGNRSQQMRIDFDAIGGQPWLSRDTDQGRLLNRSRVRWQ